MALTVRAPAKVNWTLEVLGRRPDGYHEVLTVLQTIGFYDLISMESAVEVIVQGEPEVEGLAYRAARLLQDRTGCRQGSSSRRTRLSRPCRRMAACVRMCSPRC